MTEINKKLLGLIAQNKTINQISDKLKLSHKQIWQILRNLKLKGMEFEREYHYDGNIKYIIPNGSKEINNNISLITEKNDQLIRIMLISDLHFGNSHERLDALYKIYNYCVKHNIHIIINAGDLIDGVSLGTNKTLPTFEMQIDHLIKKFPFDKNIINFICLGNHDIDCLRTNGQDLATVLYNYRHDLVSLGYGVGAINIKNETIYVKHRISNYQASYIPSESLILQGHSHKASISCNGNLSVHIPTLSNMQQMDEYFKMPGATLMTITFKNGYYKNGSFEQFIIDKSIYKVNEFTCELLPNRIMVVDIKKS